ncbi:acetyltransferase [Psychroflexus salinarum]|uniref:Acetyltransferase n=1 Tax=Psychroflexus salinarum TaxID=546024 RepID=A0ABW3GUM0_9FLAO
MIVVGAKGLAKEILQILEENDEVENLAFFDDVNLDMPKKLYDIYPILKTDREIKDHFEVDQRFILGLGKPKLRKVLCERFEKLGGQLTSVNDKSVTKGNHVCIDKGCTLMAGAKLSNGVKIGKGVLVYYDCIITHDVEIGDFVELSPGCKLLGHVKIEDEVQVGAGAVILPKVIIGKGAIIGAGAIVTKDVRPNTIVLGNPARELSKE